MEIQTNIFLKHVEKAAIEQLSLEYKKLGFEITTEKLVGDYQAGIVAKRGDEIIVFEIKAGRWSRNRRQEVQQIRNFAVHNLGAKFKLVIVNLPEESEIVVEDLESVFFELLPEQFIDEFSRMATHFWLDEISDISISNIFIRKDEFDIKGSASLSISLQYGSDRDFKRGDGIRTSEFFPFHFHILFDRNFEVKEIYLLELDTPEDFR